MRKELDPVIDQLRRALTYLTDGSDEHGCLARSIIEPQIAALEHMIARSEGRDSYIEVTDKWTIRHNDLVTMIRADAFARDAEYKAGRVSVAFRIRHLIGGAQGGALIDCDVEVH